MWMYGGDVWWGSMRYKQGYETSWYKTSCLTKEMGFANMGMHGMHKGGLAKEARICMYGMEWNGLDKRFTLYTLGRYRSKGGGSCFFKYMEREGGRNWGGRGFSVLFLSPSS